MKKNSILHLIFLTTFSGSAFAVDGAHVKEDKKSFLTNTQPASQRPQSNDSPNLTPPRNLTEAIDQRRLITRNNLITPNQLFERMYQGGNLRPNRNFTLLNIGPVRDVIRGAEDLGPIHRSIAEQRKIDNFIQRLPRLSNGQPNLDYEVVIYCGCCPAEDCDFVLGALPILRAKGLRNIKVVNFIENLDGAEWMDHPNGARPTVRSTRPRGSSDDE